MFTRSLRIRPRLIAAAAALALGGTGVYATTDVTGSLTVTATVSSTCQITGTGTTAFGSLNPLIGDNSQQNSTGLSFACSTGISPTLYITGTRALVGTGDNSTTIPVSFSYGGNTVGMTQNAGVSLGSGNSDGSSHAMNISTTVSSYSNAPADAYTGSFTVHLVY
jgi:hypothetical protein